MSISLNKKIENVQLEASRIVTGGTRLVSLNNLYMETGWGKLKDRREKPCYPILHQRILIGV
jgi:hypothetical protein